MTFGCAPAVDRVLSLILSSILSSVLSPDRQMRPRRMNEPSVTDLLAAHRAGEERAFDNAFAQVYEELRRVARHQLGGQAGATLGTTALVHEVYLKLVRSDPSLLKGRGHFIALAARAMRQITVDHARARAAGKRGGGALRVTLDGHKLREEDRIHEVLAVDEALDKIRKIDPRLEDVFECRYFTGLSEAETAEALGVSVSTVQRDWRRAKAWLSEILADGNDAG